MFGFEKKTILRMFLFKKQLIRSVVELFYGRRRGFSIGFVLRSCGVDFNKKKQNVIEKIRMSLFCWKENCFNVLGAYAP